LNKGVFLTAVGASDDKLSGQGSGPTYTPHGVPATAVYSSELSLQALRKAVKAGHVYVRTRGVADSPKVELTVTTPDGQTGRMGDSFRAKTAEAKVEISRAAGQGLRIFRDGDLIDVRPILTDEFSYTFAAPRLDDSPSPLGTWYRIETFDEQGRTTIVNPFFLTGAKGSGQGGNGDGGRGNNDGEDGGVGAAGGDGPTLPATGGGAAAIAALALLGAGMLRRG
jgi:hypothetical protein